MKLYINVNPLNDGKTHHRLAQMHYLFKKHNDLFLYDTTKYKRQLKIIEPICGKIPVYNSKDFYMLHKKECDSWIELYHKIDVSGLSECDTIYLSHSVLPSTVTYFRKSRETYNFDNKIDMFKDKRQLKFVQQGKQMWLFVLCAKLQKLYNTKIYHFIDDLGTLSIDDITYNELCDLNLVSENYTMYDVPDFRLKREDTYQAFLLDQFKNTDSEKIYNITFGYTCTTPHRQYMHDAVQHLENDPVNKLFCKNKYLGINTSIPRLTYFDFLNQSKYTLVFPAYEKTTFSALRFITALHFNCLPLIHESCEVNEYSESMELSSDIIKAITITDDIEFDFSEMDRKNIIEELRKNIFNLKCLPSI